ncbi:hypothetical protein LJC64_01575 [Ruminococcaceae bacterium OttesenSCG-928-A11]|nr:hypothetical protein [Ruminococcaceae bacterium OttesenSCG-928-A11]
MIKFVSKTNALNSRLLFFCILATFSLLAFVFIALFSDNVFYNDIDIANATSIDSDFEVKVDEVLELSLTNCDSSNSSVVSVDVIPSTNGTFKSNCQIANIHTNNPGYTLSIYQRNGLPPEEIIVPVTNPSGYNNFATDDDVDNFGNDLYNNIVSLPDGANCLVGAYPSNSIQYMVDNSWSCDDGSDNWDYCTLASVSPSGKGVCTDDGEVTGNVMCYVQGSAPGWCTSNEDGTYTTIVYTDHNLIYQNPTTLDPKPTIPSTTNTIASPNTLTNNTWGFAVEDNNNFDTTYTINNALNKYALLPTTDTTIYTTDLFPTPKTSHKFYYATKLTPATMAGTYATTVTYTAVGAEVAPAPRKFKQVDLGGERVCAIAFDDNAYCWGNGALGNTHTNNSKTPIPVDKLPGGLEGLTIKQISTGGGHVCVIASDDNAYCWGHNYDGQLGNGSNDNSNIPVVVSGDYNFKQISAGANHTCAITIDDDTYCWGDDYHNQLGDGGSNDDSSIPSLVVGGYTFKYINAGGYNTCAITQDEDVYCWGYNSKGQLGNGTNSNSKVPVPVSKLPGGLENLGVVQINNGGVTYDESFCVIANNKSAFCWGYNGRGQLGNGGNDNSNIPVAVSGNYDFIQIAAGGYDHTCAISMDNKAYCWGGNGSSQLGDGTNDNSNIPVAVSGDYKFKQISTGGIDTCAINLNDNLYCWGEYFGGNVPTLVY